MIVSASVRTDIPAFYGAWFARRLAVGTCTVANPYNGRQSVLDLEAAQAFVFWTRNPRPFRPVLATLTRPFVVQFTLTAQHPALEPHAPSADHAVAEMRALRAAHGPDAVVWRYDPILFTDRSPPDWHAATFTRLAGRLRGVVNEVVISFVHPYRKVTRRLATVQARTGLHWWRPAPGEAEALRDHLAQVAEAHDMHLTVCAHPGLETAQVPGARCIDGARLQRVAGRAIVAPAGGGTRPGCLCARSRDVGAYHTCPMGCAYCYAVQDFAAAARARARHDPAAPSLSP